MKEFLGAFAVWLFAFVGSAFAQSVSIEELKGMIDKRVDGMSEYRALLNDPDPRRSLAAMEAMIGTGDVKLLQLAQEHGFQSPDLRKRNMALRAYFSTQPVVTILYDGSDVDEKEISDFVSYGYNVAPAPGNKLAFTMAVGPYSEQMACFTFLSDVEKCAIRLSDSHIAFWVIYNRNDLYKGSMEIGSDLTFYGAARIPDVRSPLPVTMNLIR